jgi:hypothetical protein
MSQRRLYNRKRAPVPRASTIPAPLPIFQEMSGNDLVLGQGMRDTGLALRRWNRDPVGVLAPWVGLSVLIAGGLLFAIYVIAKLSRPDLSTFAIPGYNTRATLGDYLAVLYRNGLVLALHAMACVAGFMAGSSLPQLAEHRTGLSRWVHEKAGPLAIGFVVLATLFSLSTQAYILGGTASSIAGQLGTSPGPLILALAPHALPELIALFLPLAAWIVASRREEWHELLAATLVTSAIAVPVLLAAAAVELWLSPRLLAGIAG